jgi:hypothetical protein
MSLHQLFELVSAQGDNTASGVPVSKLQDTAGSVFWLWFFKEGIVLCMGLDELLPYDAMIVKQ